MRRAATGLLGTTGFVVAVLLLIAMAILVRAYLERLDKMAAWVRHSNSVIQRLNEATSDLLDLRTAERAFLATGNTTYLTQYQRAAESVPASYRAASELTVNNPRQRERAARVVVLAQKLLGDTNQAIAHAPVERTRLPALFPLTLADEQRRQVRDAERETMRELIALTREMTQDEDRLLEVRRQEVQRAQAKTSTTVLLALTLALALVIVSTWATSSNIARSKKALLEQDRLREIIELQAARAENNKFQERFIGILGHDLRNPLTAITMGVSSLMRHDLPEGDARTATRIRSSAQRMARMIDQLLDLTRSRDGGGIPINLSRLDLADVTRRVVEELEMANPERKLTLDVQGETSGHWDPDRLAQVVSNLAGNAIHHGCHDRPIAINVRGHADRVVLVVHNAGKPIPQALLPVIFDPFRRANDSSPSGLGLGLFITQQIVLAHQGDIDVVSTAEGTTFTVQLPRVATMTR